MLSISVHSGIALCVLLCSCFGSMNSNTCVCSVCVCVCVCVLCKKEKVVREVEEGKGGGRKDLERNNAEHFSVLQQRRCVEEESLH